MEVKGCVHVPIRNGTIANVFSHLTDLPENCVVHLVPEVVLSEEAFILSHPRDKNEISLQARGAAFDLGDETI